jgi:AraC-like DNA-binding protein
MTLSIPAWQLLNIFTASTCFLCTTYFLTARFRGIYEVRFLVTTLLVMVTIKVDQIYQFADGLTIAPEFGFTLLPFQWLMTPALYFTVKCRTSPMFRIRRREIAHLLPALIIALYYVNNYVLLPTSEKINLLNEGWLSTPLHRWLIPIVGDVIQLSYLIASLVLLTQYGFKLKNWFANIENKEQSALRQIISFWILIFSVHLSMVLLREFGFKATSLRYVVMLMDILHLGLLLKLISSSLNDYSQKLQSSSEINNEVETTPEVTEQLEPEVRLQILTQLQTLMQDQKPYLHNDLSLTGLAEIMQTSPRYLSEVINRSAHKNFFEFVNGYRIEEAKKRLTESPNSRIIDIAFSCGFNTKSVFNDAFKKQTGMSPTAYRKSITTD